ncbi:GNAT family N-acetyltransferase [Terrilactibacillus laevilacticus]|uniref:GNAT family N-acetyltransferase n=1 Tax=Terrilactibacillus laevilacticus TaxID=1380157 RepID=UPI0011464D48|nr:GNAT family N-acetyltransferase [Terrilactibacillus laevilacticus]
MKWHLKTFSDLTTLELYQILNERNRIFIVEQECPFQDIDDKDQDCYHLFTEKDGQMIAYLRIVPEGVIYPELSLGRIIVKKEYRKRGIAREMIDKAIQFSINELNPKKIKLQAQVQAKGLYERLGFKDVSEPYLEDGIPHVDMILEI